MRLALALVAAVTTLFGACATTTKITSDPPGAEVTGAGKDAKKIGKAPTNYESKMWIWETEQLKVTAPGYKPKTVELKRSEVDVAPTVGAVALCVCVPCIGWVAGPILFAAGGMKLPEETKVKLDRGPPTGDAAPPLGVLDERDQNPPLALRY